MADEYLHCTKYINYSETASCSFLSISCPSSPLSPSANPQQRISVRKISRCCCSTVADSATACRPSPMNHNTSTPANTRIRAKAVTWWEICSSCAHVHAINICQSAIAVMQATGKGGGFLVHPHTSPYGQDVRCEQMARSSSAPNRSGSELSSPLVQSITAKVMAQWSLDSVQALCVRACVCVLEPAKSAGCIWNSVKGSCLMLWPKGWFGSETMKVSGPVRCSCTLLPFTSAQEVRKKNKILMHHCTLRCAQRTLH